jgi:hypothetical protein
VPIEYDPLLAKLAVWNGTRETAIARMLRGLREYDVAGCGRFGGSRVRLDCCAAGVSRAAARRLVT